MDQRSPCEAYLKYLVVHPDKYTTEQIRKIVRLQQLDYIGEPYIDSLRTNCVPPNPFFPEDPLHKPSQRFLRKERLEAIFNPDDAMIAARNLLEMPQAKETIENMLMSKSEPAWICMALKRQGVDVVPDAIRRYKHYFFNTDFIDHTQINALLIARGDIDATSDPDEQKYRSAYNTASRYDSRRQTAQVAVAPLADMMNMVRMGLMPSSAAIGRIVKATQAVASFQALDTSVKGQASKGRDFAFIAKMMTEMTEIMGDVEEDLQEGLANMILKTEETEVPYIKQLTEGSHTLDVQPIEAREVDAAKKSRKK